MSQIDQNDPRLTAYALDEMSAAERAAFEPLLRADPLARAAIDEIRRTAESLVAALATEPLPVRSVVPPVHRPRHWLLRLVTESWTLWAPLGAAAAFALFFWRSYLPAQQRREEAAAHAAALAHRPAGAIPVEAADAGLAANATAAAAGTATAEPRPLHAAAPTGLAAADTAALKTGYFLTARQHPSSQFAVNVPTVSYADVRRSLAAGERPPTGLVRIEELVNAFPYRYPRPAAGEPLALATEMHPAPWSGGHLLVRIGLQGREAPGAASAPSAASPAENRSADDARALLAQNAADAIRALAARDVKVQVDFNPDRVLAYRLLGYENRLLKGAAAEPAANDDFAAGHAVTALYELIPLPAPAAPPRPALAAKPVPPPTPDPSDTAAWLTVKLRYSDPALAQARTIIVPLHAPAPADLPPASPDFKFTAAVASFGLILQDNPNKGTADWDLVEELAEPGLADDTDGARHEFVTLVKKARALEAAPAEPPASVATP